MRPEHKPAAKLLAMLFIFVPLGIYPQSLTAGVAAALPEGSRSQSGKLVLSMEDALALAYDASPDLKNAQLALLAAQNNVKHTWNLFMPGISASYKADLKSPLLFRSASVPGGASGFASNPFSNSFAVNASLSFSTAVFFDAEKRKTDLRSAEIAKMEAEARIKRDTEKAYYQLLSLDLDISNKTKALALAAERYKAAQFKFDNGLGPELDLLRANMAEKNSKAALDRAVGDMAKKLSAFKRSLKLDADTELSFSTALVIPQGQPSFDSDALIFDRLDLQKDRLAISTAMAAKERSFYTNRIALVSLGASWAMSSGGSKIADLFSFGDSASASLSVSFSPDSWIPNTQKNLAYAELVEAEQRQARKYEQDLTNARAEVAWLLMDIELNRAAMELAKGQVELAERIYDKSAEAYHKGAITALELEDSQLSLDSARQNLNSSRYQYLSLIIDLGYALNTDWRELVK